MSNQTQAPVLLPDELTPAQIGALRQADRIVFRHVEGGASRIEAIKKAGKPSASNPFPQELSVDIVCGSALSHFGREYTGDLNRSRAYRAFVMIYGKSDMAWNTVAGFLKPGDKLNFEWVASNNSDYLKAAGLHHDSVSLRVYRPSKKKDFVFHLHDSICPDNSARMVRVVG